MMDVIGEVLFGSPVLTWACVGAIVFIAIGKEHWTAAWCIVGFGSQLISLVVDITDQRWSLFPTRLTSLIVFAILVGAFYLWRIRRRRQETLEAPYPHDGPRDVDPTTAVSDEDFHKAQRLIEFGVRHPAVKEIAKLKGVTPRQVILGCEETVRNWNRQNRVRSMQ